ncbi:gustatory receptor for bitter taste 93a-like [Zootermopsis nevadensis]|uniref:gustatory receptor for bitter taste 93a-like n=1 Tax=Zootermopsis nevadensis TaxID=136037 RepID=UPI000B8E50C9|nr:gustatory receptor for bitter taste 93a-like [Zootermopsis nevadensis]
MVASCYELPLFVVIAYCFANSVFGVYLVITFRGPDSLLRITGVIWSVAYGCRLILIAVIPSVTVAQAKKSRMLVERLNNRYLDDASKQEILIFISHLSSRNISFNVCGFFTLNIPFLRSIAVAIVTYVILLMQFKFPEN